MSTHGLPVDPESPGNVWCEACQQSISESRAAAHLVSKKHLGNLPPANDVAPPAVSSSVAKSKKKVEVVASDVADTDVAEPKGRGVKSLSIRALPADEEKDGHRWCGICQVSLSAAKADKHTETASHKKNAERHLSSAMKASRKTDK